MTQMQLSLSTLSSRDVENESYIRHYEVEMPPFCDEVQMTKEKGHRDFTHNGVIKSQSSESHNVIT